MGSQRCHLCPWWIDGGSLLCRYPLLLCVHGCSTDATSAWQLFMASLSISWFVSPFSFLWCSLGLAGGFTSMSASLAIKWGWSLLLLPSEDVGRTVESEELKKKNSYWNNRGIFTTFIVLLSHMTQWKLMFKLPEQLLNWKILFKLIWGLVNLSLQINMELCVEQIWCTSSTGLQLVFAESCPSVTHCLFLLPLFQIMPEKLLSCPKIFIGWYLFALRNYTIPLLISWVSNLTEGFHMNTSPSSDIQCEERR